MYRGFLFFCLTSLIGFGYVSAQSTPPTTPVGTPSVNGQPKADSPTTSSSKAVSVPTQSVKQSAKKEQQNTQVNMSSKIQKASFSESADPNAFKKEQRLETLRYRHLWIAYSLVWLITLVFVYRTWQRSQAVASRLDELKNRLAQVESQKTDS